MSMPPRKRPRQEQPPPPPPPPFAGAQLPADLWAHILHFCYFEEVLACTAASKFLLHEVPPQMKFLLVRTGESMDVTPAAVQRFSGVKGVFVHSFVREIPNAAVGGKDSYRLDAATMKTVVPFLSALPANELFCWLGGLSRHEDDMDWTPQHHIRSDFIDDALFDSRDAWIQNQLIEHACGAFAEGKLSDNVTFRGLLPWDPPCCWYPAGRKCDYCERICNSLPPDQVIDLISSKTPCIPFADRLDIVQRRDSAAYSSKYLTALLQRAIDPMDLIFGILCPPEYTDVRYAALYSEERYEQMTVLIARGADIKDQSMRHTLVVKPDDTTEDGDMHFVNDKRVVLLETYTRLKEMGVDINEQDFVIVDSDSDRRTSYGLFVYQQLQTLCPESICEAKDRLELETGVSVGDVEAELKRILDRLDLGTSPDRHWRWVHNRLERKLGVNLAGHHDATQALFYAEFWKRYAWRFDYLIH